MRLSFSVIILSLVSLLPLSAFADSQYHLYVINQTDMPISFGTTSKTCISKGPYWGGYGQDKRILYPDNTEQLIAWWTDDNWWLCANQPKSIKFVADALVDEDKKVDGLNYQVEFQWYHKNTTSGPGGLNWKSKIITDQSENQNTPYSVFLAKCSNKYSGYSNSGYCLNIYAKQKGSYEDIWVVLMKNPEYEKSIKN